MNLIRKVQLHQIQMMSELQKIFHQENLTYFAIGGTALGAVRHEGFIPWDDDIDIAMPRVDYEKFLQLQHKLPSHLFIQNFYTEKEYPLYFTKVRDTNTLFIEKSKVDKKINHGIFIDVFPWDNVKELEKDRDDIKILLHKFRRISITEHKRAHIFRRLKAYFYQLIYLERSQSSLFAKIDSAYKKHNHVDTGKIGNVTFNDVIEIADLYPLKMLKFESIELPCPNNVEKYLSKKYGDYMKIPEEKDRITHNPVKVVLNIHDEHNNG
ncbi:MAG: LicD family protein [Shewanella sp.]